MELKHQNKTAYINLDKLLIVPYGIETRILQSYQEDNPLLIVPYGIETS